MIFLKLFKVLLHRIYILVFFIVFSSCDKEIEVNVGRTTFDSVEILQGLSEGETVIY